MTAPPTVSPPSRGKAKKASAFDETPSAAPWQDWKIEQIPLEKIRDDGHNHRVKSPAEEAALLALAESMRRSGLQQPIVVYRDVMGGYTRVFGSRRCAAADLCGWKTIAARVAPIVLSAAEVQELRATENTFRAELNPAEQALLAKQLVDANGGSGLDQAIVRTAAILGIDEKTVRDRLHVVERLTPKSREYLAAGTLNLNQARELAKIGDPKVQERYAKQIADELAPPKSIYSANAGRGGRVVSVMEIRGWVENEKRPLGTVPWELAVPFDRPAGKGLACSACPHNTARDLALFDTGKDEAQKGCCTHPACYEGSRTIVARAQSRAVEKIEKQIKAKSIEKAEAAGAAVVRDAIPEFVKVGSTQRVVKKELKLDPAKSAAAKSKNGSGSSEAALTPTQKALLAWGDAFYKWRHNIELLIAKNIKAEDGLYLANQAMEAAKPLVDLPDQYDFPTSDYSFRHGDWQKRTAPLEESPFPPKAARVLACAATRTYESLLEIAATREKAWDNFDATNLNGYGPEAVQRIAQAFGVDAGKAPAWDDFKPKASTDPKPVTPAVPDAKKPSKARKERREARRAVSLPVVDDFNEDPPRSESDEEL